MRWFKNKSFQLFRWQVFR